MSNICVSIQLAVAFDGWPLDGNLSGLRKCVNDDANSEQSVEDELSHGLNSLKFLKFFNFFFVYNLCSIIFILYESSQMGLLDKTKNFN